MIRGGGGGPRARTRREAPRIVKHPIKAELVVIKRAHEALKAER